MPFLDDYSDVPMRIELIFKDRKNYKEVSLGIATGFIYQLKKPPKKCFLISNWHVFSGRNVYTGQSLHGGHIPNYIYVYLPSKKGYPDRDERTEIPLEDEDEDGLPLWIQHEKGQFVDLAGIELDLPDKSSREMYPINNFFSNESMCLMIGLDTFILGYPLGITSNKHYPVWKRATLASEPNFDVHNKKIILVDTASAPGMSGAPVILRSIQTYLDEKNEFVFDVGVHTKFIGVYSGRLQQGDLVTQSGTVETQIGILWKAELVVEMISSPVHGDYKTFKKGEKDFYNI